MLKICQARLQHYVNQELPDIQVGFRKGRETRDQIADIHWIKEKRRTSSVSLTTTVTTPKMPTLYTHLIQSAIFQSGPLYL